MCSRASSISLNFRRQNENENKSETFPQMLKSKIYNIAGRPHNNFLYSSQILRVLSRERFMAFPSIANGAGRAARS